MKLFKNYILYLFFIFVLFKKTFCCIYSANGYSFNFTSLTLPSTQNYNVTSNSFVGGYYFSIFNFCGVPIHNCGINDTAACQEITGYENRQLGSTLNGSVSYSNSGPLEITYSSNISTECFRSFHINATCNRSVDFSIIGNGTENPRCNYIVNIESKYACPICSICSPIHSTCDTQIGICECDSQTTDPLTGCIQSMLNVTSAIPALNEGGTTIITGYFGITTLNFTITIGSIQCINILQINKTAIKCDIGPGAGLKNITITDNDLSYTGINLFEYKNCSFLHSTIDNNSGKCICDSQTKSAESGCYDSMIYISSVTPSLTTGGTVYLYGYFGNITNNFTIFIGDNKCNNTYQFNFTAIKCDIGEGKGVYDITIVDNDLSFFGNSFYQYINLEYECPNQCNNNGNCDKSYGLCICNDKYIGYDCSTQINSNLPTTNTSINENTGSASIQNENIKFDINLYSLLEISINGSIVNEHYLFNQSHLNYQTIPSSSSKNIIYQFNQTLNLLNDQTSNIIYSINEINDYKTDFNFADIPFTLYKGSLKLTISIKNYKFLNSLNTLQLRLKTTINNDTIGKNDCNSNPLEIDNQLSKLYDQKINYLFIKKDSKNFVSRFINRVIIDNRITSTSFNIIDNEKNSILIGINLNHCVEECLIDPDFSILVNPSFKDDCSSKTSKTLIVSLSVIIPGIAITASIIAGAIIFRKHRIYFLIKLNNLRKNNIFMEKY